MGFLHQLKLLLWKNLTLKKRNFHVLLLEISIPLVLFIIVLLIRMKLPAIPYGTSTFAPKPLPSSGIVSIMQVFCESSALETDSHFFTKYPRSSSYEFLKNFQSVAEHNNFFDPGYSPDEMQDLPKVYESIIDNQASLHDLFNNAQDFSLGNNLQDPNKLLDFLQKNVSLSTTAANAILHSTVNIKEVYRLLFGLRNETDWTVSRRKRDVGDVLKYQRHQERLKQKLSPEEGKRLAKSMIDMLNNLGSQGDPTSINNKYASALIYKTIIDNDLWKNPELLPVLGELMGFGQPGALPDPYEVADVLKIVVFSPTVIHDVACNPDELEHLLQPQPPYNRSDLVLAQIKLCNMSSSQLSDLSNLLKAEVSDDKIVDILSLYDLNLNKSWEKVSLFKENLLKFYQFQENLIELSLFAQDLPLDACPAPPHPDTVPSVMNTTALPDNTTAHVFEHTTQGHKHHKYKNRPQYAGLLKVWLTLQKMLCGVGLNLTAINEDNIEDLKLTDLGLSKKQQHDIGILLYVLYSNPKVLYSPVNTSADSVIQKANTTFALIDRISDYATKWQNVSLELREYVEKNTTKENLEYIKEMQKSGFTGLLSYWQNDPEFSKFINMTVPSPAFLLHQLDVIDNAACSWLALMKGFSLNVFKGFETEDKLVEYFLNDAYHDNVSVIGSIVFENLRDDGSLPPHVQYKIRQNASFTHSTKFVRAISWYPGPGPGSYPYYQFGFVWLQDIIERAIIDIQVGRDVIEPGNYVQQFPFPCYMNDQFVFLIGNIIPLCLMISWVYSVAMLVQSIVYEKEQRLKEVMKMMGLSNAVHWCAWFLTSFVQMTITMGALTAMLKYGDVLKHSDPLVVFIVLECFAVATICQSFLVSVFYSKAKLAAAWAGIIYFMSYVPYMYLSIREEVGGDHISAPTKTFASLLSVTAFGLGGKYFAFFEKEGTGVQWTNIYISPMENDAYSLFSVIVMMLIDALIYFILAWYIENIHPGAYGLPRPWYFPFTRAYWCLGDKTDVDCNGLSDCLSRRRDPYVSLMEEDQACAMSPRDSAAAQSFEAEPSHISPGVIIDNLTKVYKRGKKLAVKNLSLNLYEGQITSFLGHNGAGKTTTMSILTGLFPPTSGFASIYGHDIRTDMDIIRKSLGMCPQHNVLFDQLTVEEHLWFYARLKGMEPKAIKTEMEMLIADVGLPKKRKSTVDCLSGGMQRKLSVAIAFVGGSQTVILDEPTAGVDPYARRAIWDLLIKYKHGRTILLSTHHMDEADILGDRIAIISNGELKCCGSSVFLKTMFGEGYHLYLAKKEMEQEVQNPDESVDEIEEDIDYGQRGQFQTNCRSSDVTTFINKYTSTAYLKSETARELHYILPFEEAKKGNFEKLFQELDHSLDQLHVTTYGIMDTNLEEVFLTVAEKAREEEADEENKPKDLTAANGLHADSSSNQSPDDSSLTNLLGEGSDDSLLERGGLQLEGMDVPLLDCGGLQLSGRDTSERARSNSDTSLDIGPHSSAPNLINTQENHPTPRGALKYDRILLEGRGSHVLSAYKLRLNQFRAVFVKRFHYIRRNWKSLFSQILLPALFVCVAMTVALSAPGAEELPPLDLSPSQYFNLTQPKGNSIPFNNEREDTFNKGNRTNDAGPEELIMTLKLPSGVGATCVLKSPFDSDYDNFVFGKMNFSLQNYELLLKYFEPSCKKVFFRGLPLDNFVPRVRKIANLGQGDSNENFTVAPSQASGPLYYPQCHCSEDKAGYVCPKHDNHINPTSFKVVTSDVLQNITGQNIDQYLLFTSDEFVLHRYGALSFGLVHPSVPQDFGNSAPTEFKKIAVRDAARAWFNHKGYHSMATYLNVLNNAILRANLPRSMGNPAGYGITVINHPMNQTNNKLSEDYILQGADVLIAIFVIVAMSFVPASFVLFLVYEKSIKAKHLQFISGINPVVYWLANYMWDMCNYLIPGTCIIGILVIFDIPAYVSHSNLPAVVSLLIMYGYSITPMMYPASFWFKEPSTAYICLIVINLFIGITCVVTSFMLEMFSYNKDISTVNGILKNVFLIFPNYCLGRGLMDIAFNEYRNEYYFKTGQFSSMQSPLVWGITGSKLVAMTTVGLFFFLITLLCEYGFFWKPRHHAASQSPILEEDVDVAAERKRVLRGCGKYDLLRIENLTKIYKTRKLGKHLAVDRLCLGVPAGECFGLLGVNGAGKTTTFKMLTGDMKPTSGSAFINRYSILKELLKAQQTIGYCPQFDALYDKLSAREHLYYYARLRGVPPKDEAMVVEWALTKLNLMQYADKPSGTYSGGNKRKLSTAIALIGHPSILLMDEPTTGMDPHSRRFLWDLILGLIKDGRSVILTSHSMEECEALCTRLAIMVNGRLQCLGSSQHLKTKFGDGYTISIRVKGPDFEHSSFLTERFMERSLTDAVLKERHYNILQYELRSQHLSLANVFSRLEEAKQDLPIEDYSISQNTLDNVFINFVKQQAELVQESEQPAPDLLDVQTPRTRTETPRTRTPSYLESNRSEDLELLLGGDGEDDDDNYSFRLNHGTRLDLLSFPS